MHLYLQGTPTPNSVHKAVYKVNKHGQKQTLFYSSHLFIFSDKIEMKVQLTMQVNSFRRKGWIIGIINRIICPWWKSKQSFRTSEGKCEQDKSNVRLFWFARPKTCLPCTPDLREPESPIKAALGLYFFGHWKNYLAIKICLYDF